MHKRPELCTKHQQAGLALVEALVSTLLLLILFVGMNHLLSRSLTLQGQDYALSLTLFDIREQLQQPGLGINSLCGGTGGFSDLMLAEGLTPSASCETINSVSVTLPGLGGSVSVPVTQISVSTPQSDQSDGLTGRLYGGDGVIKLSTSFQEGPNP